MRSKVVGAVVAVVGIALLGAAMLPLRAHLSVATSALVLVMPVVAGAAIGGLSSGLVAVAAGFVAYDVLFIPPYGTLTVGAPQNWAALGVYAVVMLIVSRVVAFLHQARSEAGRHEEATRRLYLLSDLLIGDQAVTGVLEVIATTVHQLFGARWVAVLLPTEDGENADGAASAAAGPPDQRASGGSSLQVAATAGEPLTAEELASLRPVAGRAEHLQWRGRGETVVRVTLSARTGPIGLVAMAGPPLDEHDMELLTTYANQAALALERSQLREQALRSELLAEVDRLRGAMMGAVSHDLRTPLASVKTAVTALRREEHRTDTALSAEDRAELLTLVEEQTDALDRLVANLLDMTRIQAGALEVRPAIVPVPDVIDGALRASAVPAAAVRVDLPDDLPPVLVDQVLMEQALANLLDNAARHSPEGVPVEVAAAHGEGVVQVTVTDRGPGIPAGDRERVFQMFNRSAGGGRAGLGLAIAKAFAEAHGQSVRAEDAPGGGARLVVTLPAAAVPADVP